MKKKYVLLFSIVFSILPIFSFAPRIESLRVMNYSNQNVIVEVEYNAGIPLKEENYFLEQKMNDMVLMVKDRLWNFNIIKPYDSSYIYDIFPLGYLSSGDLYEQMLAFPFMEKVEAICKSLTIKKEDGSFIITLDTLAKQIIKKEVLRGQTLYYIEVFDDDLEGKPASEW